MKEGFHAAGEKDLLKLRDARDRYDATLTERALADRPDVVLLAGWMHVFSEAFLRLLDSAHVPIINLHPRYQARLLVSQRSGSNVGRANRAMIDRTIRRRKRDSKGF